MLIKSVNRLKAVLFNDKRIISKGRRLIKLLSTKVVTAQEKRRQSRSIMLICNLEYKTKERR